VSYKLSLFRLFFQVYVYFFILKSVLIFFYIPFLAISSLKFTIIPYIDEKLCIKTVPYENTLMLNQ